MTDTSMNSPCTKAQAKTLTKRIRDGVDQVWSLLLEAHERKAWAALGYTTWADYVNAEFDMSRQNSYLLLDQGRAVRAIEEAAGVKHAGQISQRDAVAIKADLPAVTDEIRSRVASGEKPEKVAVEVIAAKRAERNTKQAENDATREQACAALPEAIRRAEEAKARNGASQAVFPGNSQRATRGIEQAVVAERDELLEENAALKADIAERDRRLAMFDDMAVQFEKGGFEAVIATKDEQIRVLRRQVEDESADKATWAKRAEYWKKQAVALGFAPPTAQAATALSVDVDADLAPF
jgi:hypothetical protein